MRARLALGAARREVVCYRERLLKLPPLKVDDSIHEAQGDWEVDLNQLAPLDLVIVAIYFPVLRDLRAEGTPGA